MGIHQSSVRARASQAFLGMLAFATGLNYDITAINEAPQRGQTGTITVDTATDGAVYEFSINGVDISFTAGVSESTSTIATKIEDAINSNPLVRGQVSASAAAAVVTLSSTFPGISFSASSADAKLTVAESTAAALEAREIPFGRLVALTGWLDEDPEQNVRKCRIAESAALTAQTKRWTYTYEASLVLKASITIDGITYAFEHTSATDADTSVAALAAKINEGVPDGSVVATTAAAVLILTADDAGVDFDADVYFGSVVGGAGELVLGSPLVGAGMGSSLSFGGISVRRTDEEQSAAAPNAGVQVLLRGSIWVANEGGSPQSGDSVYVYAGATAADQGKLYAAPGTDRIKLPKSVAHWSGHTDETGELSLLIVDFNA